MRKKLIVFQRNEITESMVYARLANMEQNLHNREVLNQISAEESVHYQILKKYTGTEVAPDMRRVRHYCRVARLFGLNFAIRSMESGEQNAYNNYADLAEFPQLLSLAKEEQEHEKRLMDMINEERLSYMSSIVLGLNDALVEFTGALAGFTLALNDSGLIALTGSITGIAAALSMASSEYLATKSEKDPNKRPVKAAVYTGIAYLITVALLVAPFIVLGNVITALCVMLLLALTIIGVFNYYYAVARGESFRKRFGEMAALSFSVAAISFLIGYLLKLFTGIEA